MTDKRIFLLGDSKLHADGTHETIRYDENGQVIQRTTRWENDEIAEVNEWSRTDSGSRLLMTTTYKDSLSEGILERAREWIVAQSVANDSGEPK